MSNATMTDTRTIAAPQYERVLGRYTTGREGPTVVIVAGLHGNEPAGTHALRRVFAQLEAQGLPLRGRLIGLTGNIGALRLDQRFVARDLNRGWTRERIVALLDRDAARDQAEDHEQRELLAIFREVFAAAREPVVFLDLHSTSAGGAPFCAMADTLRNRRIAFSLPVPVILGLEETIAGTMLSYLDGLGHVSVVFEGGQNRDPSTVDNDESAVWITLVAAGALRRDEVPGHDAHHARLAALTGDIPHVVEVCHRHGVTAADRYVMRPGYQNFTPIKVGEVLADDVRGEVRSGYDARILMPLYQKQGDDGYFVVRAVAKRWLSLSAWIRRLRLDVFLPLLPGVRKDAENPDVLIVDPRVARYLVLEIFHLFGFRASGEANGKLLFARRRPEFRGIDRAGGIDLADAPE
jgi:predicted deacylase